MQASSDRREPATRFLARLANPQVLQDILSAGSGKCPKLCERYCEHFVHCITAHGEGPQGGYCEHFMLTGTFLDYDPEKQAEIIETKILEDLRVDRLAA